MRDPNPTEQKSASAMPSVSPSLRYEFPVVLCTISTHVLWVCSICQIHAGEDTYLWQCHLCVVPTGCVSHQEMPGDKALAPLLPFSYLMRLQRGRGRKQREGKQSRLLVTQGQEDIGSRSLSRAPAVRPWRQVGLQQLQLMHPSWIHWLCITCSLQVGQAQS